MPRLLLPIRRKRSWAFLLPRRRSWGWLLLLASINSAYLVVIFGMSQHMELQAIRLRALRPVVRGYIAELLGSASHAQGVGFALMALLQNASQPRLRWHGAQLMAFPVPEPRSQVHPGTSPPLPTLATQVALLGAKVEPLSEACPDLLPVVGRLSDRYGMRARHPILRYARHHKGIDIAAARGTVIVAAGQGVVTRTTRHPTYGNLVVIDHGFGMSTRYAHCERFLVTQGAQVRKGQPIATVGATGRAQGSHLHFEVWRQGSTMDPMGILRHYPNTASERRGA